MISKEKLLKKLEKLEEEIAILKAEIANGVDADRRISLRGFYSRVAVNDVSEADFQEAKNIWRPGTVE